MTIKIEKIKEEKKKNKMSFLLNGSNTIFANTIRRMIVEEVPTLAVEDLEIKDNNSALYDEMVGLRLGLTPIKTDLKSYELKENCRCEEEGCARCELKMTLKASKKGYVYAGNAVSTDPKCKFVHENMPITKLLAKQKVDIIMTAVLGRGREHTKWSPGWAYYNEEPIIKIGKVSNPMKIIDNCTDGVFVMKNKTLTVVKEKVYNSLLLDYYASLDNGLTLEHTDNIVFNVEGWGQLSCKEMLIKAGDVLLEKVDEFEGLLKEE